MYQLIQLITMQVYPNDWGKPTIGRMVGKHLQQIIQNLLQLGITLY